MDGNQHSARSDGAVSFIFGVLVGYFGVYQAVVDVSQGARVVQISGLAFLIFPLILIQGAIYMILGQTAEKHLGSLRTPNQAGWVLRAILISAGIGLFLWFESQRLGKGYR